MNSFILTNPFEVESAPLKSGNRRGKVRSKSKEQETLRELSGYSALDVKQLGLANEEAWQPHTKHAKDFILRASELVPNKGTCTVIGAGPCFDVPLMELAEQYDRVELLDLNKENLQTAISTLPEELAKKVTPRVVEVTHVLPKALSEIKQEIAKAGTRTQRAINKIVGVLNKHHPGPGELGNIQSDFIVSDMILSQLPTSLWIVDDWFTRAFPSKLSDYPEWFDTMRDFQAKLQAAHVEALLAKQNSIVALLTDYGVATTPDEANLQTLLDIKRVTLSVGTLNQLMELQNASTLFDEWVWQRESRPLKFSPVWAFCLA